MSGMKDGGWARQAAALVVAEMEPAPAASAARVIALAAALARASGSRPCPHCDAGLDLCGLAAVLTAPPGGLGAPDAAVPTPAGDGDPNSLAGLHTRFFEAILVAAPAVAHCRRVRHPSGTCLFSPSPGVHLCGLVLATTHRAQTRQGATPPAR